MQTLFDIDHTLDRRNESHNSIQPSKVKTELKRIIDCLRSNPFLSSRKISEITKIERTSVTRVLAENKNLFDVTKEFRDPLTNKRVTLYKVK